MAHVSFKKGCRGNGIHIGQEQRIIVYLAVLEALLTRCQPINHKTINLGQIPLGRSDGEVGGGQYVGSVFGKMRFTKNTKDFNMTCMLSRQTFLCSPIHFYAFTWLSPALNKTIKHRVY